MKRILGYIGGAILALFVIIQLIPMGRNHTNPPVVQEPEWDSDQTRELVARACFDCHSHETTWPWYANVAPMSWVTERHVTEGREHLNFSDWGDGHHEDFEDISEVVIDGEMPLPAYLLGHPNAQLTAAEQQQMLDGLRATIGTHDDHHGGDDDHHGDDDDHHGDDDHGH
ncbi:MAG TPA: heme-binding domain-containing protein [Anaerolineae bacterium]|nr:heme-binding domain-containing protein [Anaerolineae bacterium]